MVSAAEGRPLIEMGSRRTHERAAVAAARAAYIAGFAASSNLEAQRRYGVPTEGTSAHAFTCCTPAPTVPTSWPRSRTGRRTGRRHHAAGGHLRRDDRCGQRRGRRRHRARRGPHRLRRPGRAGPPGPRTARPARRHRTRIVVSGDLDEFAIAGAARRTGGQLRRRHVAGHRLGRARPRTWSTSWSRWTACRSRSAAATRNPTAAAKRRCGCPARPARSPRRSCIPAGHPPSTAEPSRVLTMPLVRGGRAVVDLARKLWARRASWWRRACEACRGRV